MAVLVEAISVVVRIDALRRSYPGGWEGFRTDAPNLTLCADDDIARVGFMVPDDARFFVEQLQRCGIRYLREDTAGPIAEDLVVVDQFEGPLVSCDWIEFGHFCIDGDPLRKVAACKFAGKHSPDLVTPAGWDFTDSLSEKTTFVPNGELSDRLKYLGTEDGVDVYLDKVTGRKKYVGRS